MAATTTSGTTTKSKATAKTAPKRRGRGLMRRDGADLAPTWAAYAQEPTDALRNELVEAYHYIVRIIGNRIASRLPRSIDVQDLRSAGTIGLMRAVENFDQERGTPFESYGALRVRGAILDELRAQDWVPRLVRNRASEYTVAHRDLRLELGREPMDAEVADRLGRTIDDTARMRRESNFTTVFNINQQDDREEESQALRRIDALMDRRSDVPFDRMVTSDLARAMVHTLNRQQQTLIALYYEEGLRMREIGSVMGISESRVCQIHSDILRVLRKHIERLGDDIEAPERMLPSTWAN